MNQKSFYLGNYKNRIYRYISFDIMHEKELRSDLLQVTVQYRTLDHRILKLQQHSSPHFTEKIP